MLAPSVSKLTETSCFVEWSPVKPIGEDRILYQLQLLNVKDSEEYRVVSNVVDWNSFDGVVVISQFLSRSTEARTLLSRFKR